MQGAVGLELAQRVPELEGLAYTRIRVDTFLFHQVVGILVLQGMPLQDLFPPDAHFARSWLDAEQQVLVRGPFVLLKGTLSESWDPPLRLENVVLVALEQVPPDTTREEVLALLLKEVV